MAEMTVVPNPRAIATRAVKLFFEAKTRVQAMRLLIKASVHADNDGIPLSELGLPRDLAEAKLASLG